MRELFAKWHGRPLLWGITGLILGAALGTGGAYFFIEKNVPPQNTPLRESNLNSAMPYKFIDPLIGLQGSGAVDPAYKPLEDSINDFISAEETKGNVTDVSVKFGDVTRSGGFSINPSDQYSPASLLKVPIMMAYFQLAESNPSILDDTLVYTGESNENEQEHFAPSFNLVAGKAYTVEELIEHMIKYSDNNAVTLLVAHLNATNNQDAFTNLAKNLGIEKIDLTDDFITVQAYSLFFRVLYNATYLSRDYSEKALELLSQTDFDSGIVSAVGAGIPVAHKFGEFSLLGANGQPKDELHDCGYIYYPKHIYSLCVMTKGNGFGDLEDTIAGISKLSYDFIVKSSDEN